ncbi:MAG: sigma-70 family RNA polymerase sigma factor [Solirubrobacterales bacterium]
MISKPRDSSAYPELSLLKRFRQTGDNAALDELVELMLPWVRRVALRYANRGQDIDDLIQVGSVGLLKAIERFDFDRGVLLTTFAEPTVAGEIKRYFRDHSWTVRPPRDLQELSTRVRRSIDSLSLRLQRSPTPAEIAEALEITVEDVLEAIHAGAAHDSVPLTTGDDPDTTGAGNVPAVTDRGLAQTELRATLGSALAGLSDRDKAVVHMSFFQDLTQSEIAAAVGVSQMQVSRILRAALKLARGALAEGS